MTYPADSSSPSREPIPSDSSPTQRSRPLLVAATRGLFWTGSTQVLGQTLHIGIRLLLARLLLPSDFGLVAMAMIFLSFTALTSDLGLGHALTQRRKLNEQHRSSALWASLTIAVLLCGLFLTTAPLIGTFFHEPRVIPVVRILSLSFLFGAPESVYSALLLRRLDFKGLGLRRIYATLAAGAASLAAAFSGLGVWALVIYALVSTATSSILLMLHTRWIPRSRFDLTAARQLWAYGRWVTGSRLLNYLNRNSDNLLIGRYLGAAPLGLYSFSYQAVLLPLAYVARPIAAVSFPSFAQLQADLQRCARAYMRTLELISIVAWPMAALGAVAAPAAIPQIIGDKWSEAIPIFQILSGVAAMQALMSLAPSLFEGLGYPQIGFRWTVLTTTLNVSGFLLGLAWGPMGVATGLLVSVSIQVPCQWLLLYKLIPLPRWGLISVFLRSVLLFVATAVIWRLAASFAQPEASLPGLATCLLTTVTFSLLPSFALFSGGWRFLHQAIKDTWKPGS